MYNKKINSSLVKNRPDPLPNSKLLIIDQFETKVVITVTVFGLAQIFTIVFFRFLLSLDLEDISNSRPVFQHISKHLEARQK